MELFDTHFHFYGEQTPPEFLSRIREDLLLLTGRLPADPGEISLRLLAAGGDYWESVRSRAFAQVTERTCFACGVHPHQAEAYRKEKQDFSEFRDDPRLVAVGEIGLDYFYDESPRDVQREVLEEFLALALEWNRPAMLHLRDQRDASGAYLDALAMLKDFSTAGGRFVVHCCTAPWEMTEEFLALGAMIGVTGMVTFRGAQAVRDMLKIVPDDRLLIETDSPYLAPIPFRGKENTPGMLPLVAAKLAEERHTTLEAIARLTAENGCRFYGTGE